MIQVEESRALIYARNKGWNFHENSTGQLVADCPLCAKEQKFYMAVGGIRDGSWDCKVCGESGNLYQIMERLGDRLSGVSSMQDMAMTQKQTPLPDFNAAHEALLKDEEAMAYLDDVRGLSIDIIERMKLGVMNHFFPSLGQEAKAIVIPYFHNDKGVYCKIRSLPPAAKAFDGPSRVPPLFNEDVVTGELEELIMAEGEIDCLTLLDQGIPNVVGVPGANVKTATWLKKIDDLTSLKTVYLLYDSDKVGQKAAHAMAVRIGLDKCKLVVLPKFMKANCDGVPGKDINEWFAAGYTVQEFRDLLTQATQFDVEGVQNVVDILDDLDNELANKTSLRPAYDSPWKTLNNKFGGAEPGDVVDIIAEAKRGKSTMALDWLDYLVAQYEEPGLFFCLEMSNVRLVRKWVSYVTQTDDSIAQTEQEAIDKLVTMRAAIASAKVLALARKADIMFANRRIKSADDVFDLIRQAVRRYGVKFVVFDNLQMLCDLTLKNQSHRTVHLSQISKRFKDLATELKIVVFRVIQPNRVREGDIVDAGNADGSSQIEKDCDAMIALHRNKRVKLKADQFAQMGVIDEAEFFDPHMLVKVSLSRYAAGGLCSLWFDGARSTVKELSEADVKNITPGEKTPGGLFVEQEQQPAEA